MNLDTILQGDCLEVLKTLPPDSVDLVATDPPYGIGFMGKEWDTFKPDVVEKGVEKSSRKNEALIKIQMDRNERYGTTFKKGSPSMEAARYDHTPAGARKFREWFTNISVELLRVMKPGAFAFVCIGARQDSVSACITAMTEAGFKTDFTSLFWTYASGFPKAANISKMVDKRLGFERERTENPNAIAFKYENAEKGQYSNEAISNEAISNEAISNEAKTLQGSYAGFQPKPAVEVIVVAMKPLSEETFLDQALKNGKGITWLDDAKIPGEDRVNNPMGAPENSYGGYGATATATATNSRFPANLLVSNDALNGHSRFFSLDRWAEETMPFLIVPKAEQSEKNEGLDEFEKQTVSDGPAVAVDNAFHRGETERVNSHPTVKPIKLMSYLITLGSRPGDTVLDPFLGSGTTALAAKTMNRNYIGIEREKEYCDIAEARLSALTRQPTLI